MAAGVAPFVVSNPMNMIVASHAGLNSNLYAWWMVPISVVGWIVAFLILRRLFASDLRTEPEAEALVSEQSSLRLSRAQRTMLILLLAVLGAYPIVASIDSSAIWLVSAGGALAAVTLVWRHGRGRPAELLAGVAWEILVFLAAVFVMAIGLRNVGLVDHLASLYADAGIWLIGVTAALGSAVLNNHPAAIINMLALDGTPNTGHREILAILIGGDLGPRLLPIGSLAGLLWLESCRKLGLEISLRQFVRIGFTVTVPTLVVSLLMLSLR